MVAILSVSGGDIGKDCQDIIRLMKECALVGDVTANTTVNKDGSTEHGCRILLAGKEPLKNATRLFNRLQTNLNVTCAHLHTHEFTDGCILDAIAPSHCPGPA